MKEAICKNSRYAAELGELLCYGRIEDIVSFFLDEKTKALRFALGQYIKKGACNQGVIFDEYCQALSPDIAGGILKEARELGIFPQYRKSMAKKYKIGRTCGSTYTAGIYGYLEE